MVLTVESEMLRSSLTALGEPPGAERERVVDGREDEDFSVFVRERSVNRLGSFFFPKPGKHIGGGGGGGGIAIVVVDDDGVDLRKCEQPGGSRRVEARGEAQVRIQTRRPPKIAVSRIWKLFARLLKA